MSRPSLEFDLRAAGRRAFRASDVPTVSIVVPSTAGRAVVQAFVTAVAPLCARVEAELLVVRAGTAGDAASLGRHVPAARVVHAPPGADDATLRSVGLSKASGDVVAFCDERTPFDAAWIDALVRRGAEGTPQADAASRLSVIVAARNAAETLPVALAALAASDLPRERWDLVVVDDASEDDTALVAAAFADTIVRLPGSARGPAYARNRGAESARGDLLVFIDPAVAVHPDALSRFAALFEADAEVSAAFGSYDRAPRPRGLLSQYQPLLYHFAHQQDAGDAETFWAGCGAVRASVFREAGMYDEWRFHRPQVEDMELGHRIRARGRRIVLRPEILVTSLASWTLRGLVARDIADRAVPRVRLLPRGADDASERGARTALGPQPVEVANTILVWATIAALLVGLFGRSSHVAAVAALVAVLCLPPFVLLNRRLFAFFVRTRGVAFAFGALPLHLLTHAVHGVAVVCGYLLHQAVGEPHPDPAMQAFSEVGVKTWPPVPVKRGNG